MTESAAQETQPSTVKKGIPLDLIIDYIEAGLHNTEIAKLVDCSHQNISARLQTAGIKPHYLAKFKNHRADVLAAYQMKILNSLQAEDYKKASLVQKTTAFGTLYDKERLERGQSTENIAYADMVRVNAQIEEKLQTMREKLGIEAQETPGTEPCSATDVDGNTQDIGQS